MKNLQDIANSLLSYCGKQFKWEKPPKLFFQDDPGNANNLLGKTAYYDPEKAEITVFITNRHPKDILRSISHEAVHHMQNLKGELEKISYHGPGYAQKDPDARDLEKRAYLLGNIFFRDWEDATKQNLKGANIMMTEHKLKKMIREVLENTINEQYLAEEDPLPEGDLYPVEFTFDEEVMEDDMTPEGHGMHMGEMGGGPPMEGVYETDFEEDLMESILKEFKLIAEKKKTPCGPGANEAHCFSEEDEPELEEGGKALRTGNEDRFAGNEDRFADDRVHEDADPEVEEGNAFSAALAQAKKDGKTSFNVDGKEYQVQGGSNEKSEPKNEGKIRTPEQERAIYENRFGPRNEKLFKKLLKEWVK